MRGEYQYRDLCVSSDGRRAALLVVATHDGAREGFTVSLGDQELESPVGVAASAHGALRDVYRCAFDSGGELMVIGRDPGGTVLALVGGAQKPRELVLGTGGYEVLPYDLLTLGPDRFVMVGSKELTGFAVLFDLATSAVTWRAMGREGKSLIAGAERTAAGEITLCGQEGDDQDAELFSAGSKLIVATLDERGGLIGELRLPGRGCQVVSGVPRASVLYETGEPIPGPLHLLSLDDGPAVKDDRKVLDRIAYFITLGAVSFDGKIAVLDRPFLHPRIQWIDPTTAGLLGTSPMELPMSATMALVARGDELIVVTQPSDDPSRRGRVRIDAFRLL